MKPLGCTARALDSAPPRPWSPPRRSLAAKIAQPRIVISVQRAYREEWARESLWGLDSYACPDSSISAAASSGPRGGQIFNGGRARQPGIDAGHAAPTARRHALGHGPRRSRCSAFPVSKFRRCARRHRNWSRSARGARDAFRLAGKSPGSYPCASCGGSLARIRRCSRPLCIWSTRLSIVCSF